MKAYNSGGNKENCSPISSNCVIWQGPDLACINLCKGDTVSDVVYKVATELCEIQTSLNFNDLDFECILNMCGTTTQPAPNLTALIQFIFDKICCTYQVATGQPNVPGGPCCYEEPVLTLPACLQYNDPVTSLPVTQLVLSQFVLRVAQKLCDLTSTVTLHTSQISSLDGRVTVLENAPCCYTPPTVTPNCVLPSVPTQMDLVLDAVESQFCSLVTVLGSNTQISNATAQQCTNLNLEPALSQVGTMAGLPNWNNVVSNFAQSMQNLWITVCDMRAAIISLKNCCDVDCSAFILGFTALETDASRLNITLIFNSLTVIPSGYANCSAASTIKVTDGITTYTITGFDLVTNATLPGGYSFSIPLGLLNNSLPHTVTVDGCIIKDGTSCDKTVSQVLPVPTTTTTSSTTTTTTSVPVAATIDLFAEDDGLGDLVVNSVVTSGTTLNNITFVGTVQKYTDPSCTVASGAPVAFSFTLNAGIGSANSGSLGTSAPALKLRIVSLTANGTPITIDPQTISISGNNYTITGFNDCAPL